MLDNKTNAFPCNLEMMESFKLVQLAFSETHIHSRFIWGPNFI